MKAKITKRAVDAAKPAKRDWFLWDTDVKGFGLKVTPNGNRVYVLQYRFNRWLRRYTIGKHGSPWTPDEARTEAERLLGMVAERVDPAEVKAADKAAMSVAELCDLYLAEGVATKKGTTLAMDRSRIERHVKPLLGRLPVGAVTRTDIARFMQDVAAGKTARDEKTGFRGRSIVKGGKGVATRTVGMLGAGDGPCAEELARGGGVGYSGGSVDRRSEVVVVASLRWAVVCSAAQQREVGLDPGGLGQASRQLDRGEGVGAGTHHRIADRRCDDC